MAHRSGSRWLALSTLAVACGGCGGESDPSSPAPPSKDPAHCAFETPPAHPEAPPPLVGPIRAGVGSAVLHLPIGAPLGGYGDRLIPLGGSSPPDKRPKRFTTSFVPSVGMHDAPQAHAMALEAGGERFVLVRADLPLVTENSLFELESAAAPDGSLRGRILLTASHSHAAWAGWQPSLHLTPGIDLPRKELSDRMVAAMAEAVGSAIAAMEPAKIGIAVDTDFDPADTLTKDRRGENDAVLGPDGNTAGMHKDPIAWAMRVDRADGTPMAALVNVAVHGTIGEGANPLISTDAPGAIARALEAELGYPVLHLQGAAGDITPWEPDSRQACPDVVRCLDMPGLEMIGARAVPLLGPLVNDIQTGDTAALEVVTRSFHVGRDSVIRRPNGTELRYAPFDPEREADGVIFDGAGKIVSPLDEFNSYAGAGLCGEMSGSLASIPGATGIGPYASCLDVQKGGSIIFGLFGLMGDDIDLPLCDTVRATVTAVRVVGTPSGDWLIAGAPGEPTAPFASYLRARSPAGPDRTLLIGYTDDHIGYLLTAEDWLAGGYEPSTNLWGPLEGEMIVEGMVEAAGIAWTPEREDPEKGSSRFPVYPYVDLPLIAPIVTTDHGTAVTGLPSIWWPDTTDPSVEISAPSVARAVGAARFAWYGGDPAVDMPEVVVERETSPGQFEPVRDARGRPASSRTGAVVLTYTPDPLESAAPERHVYAAVWQPVPPDPFSTADTALPCSLPLGQYRLRAAGTALAASGEVTYDIASSPFDVIAAPLDASSSAARGATWIDIQAMLGAPPGLRALRVGPSDVSFPLPGPWKVTVTLNGMQMTTYDVTPDATGKGTVTLSAADASAAVSVEVRDLSGNGGVLML